VRMCRPHHRDPGRRSRKRSRYACNNARRGEGSREKGEEAVQRALPNTETCTQENNMMRISTTKTDRSPGSREAVNGLSQDSTATPRLR
jgi:hypothetical protein